MVSGEHRFHGLSSFRFVRSKGRVVRGQYFATRYALNSRRKTYRVSIVVSKKVSKSAVVRNRIRRRLYEVVRQQEASIVKPFDIAIMVYAEELANMSAKDLLNQVEKQLKTAGII